MKKSKKKQKKTKPKFNEHGKLNTRPIIWTRVKILEELTGMLTEIRENSKIIFSGELFEQRDYSRLYISRWAKNYKNDEEICNTIERIEKILESRTAVGALKGSYNPHFAKFHLINNHGWKDKSEVENNHKGLSLGNILAKAAEEEGEE